MSLAGVLFDFGHTLFDVREPGVLVSRTASALGLEVEETEAAELWAPIARAAQTPEEIARQRDVSAAAHRENWVRLLAPLDRHGDGLAEATYAALLAPENWEPYPDTPETLRALAAADVPVAIVSDIGWDLRTVFAHHFPGETLASHFVLSFEHGAVKPAARLFESALRALDVAPERALMVGDNPATDGGASAFGIPVLILPAARRGEPRGLRAVLDLAGVRGEEPAP